MFQISYLAWLLGIFIRVLSTFLCLKIEFLIIRNLYEINFIKKLLKSTRHD